MGKKDRSLFASISATYDPEVYHEVEVVPYIVLMLNMVRKANGMLAIKRVAVDATDETYVLHVVFDLILQVALLGKGVDHNAKDDVEQHDDHCNVEEQVNRPAYFCFVRVGIPLLTHIGQALRQPFIGETQIERRHQAVLG